MKKQLKMDIMHMHRAYGLKVRAGREERLAPPTPTYGNQGREQGAHYPNPEKRAQGLFLMRPCQDDRLFWSSDTESTTAGSDEDFIIAFPPPDPP
jgi:hypothetical protein